MKMNWWQKTAVLAGLSIIASVLAYLAISEPWYHYHETMLTSEGETVHDAEFVFFLENWIREYGSVTYNMTYHQGSNFWVPAEPIHSFMATIQTLVYLCVAVPLVAAALALLPFRIPRIAANTASVALFAGVFIAFALGFVNASNDADLPAAPDIPSFMGSDTEDYVSLVRDDTWGPVSAWWLMLLGCAIQGVGLALALKFSEP